MPLMRSALAKSCHAVCCGCRVFYKHRDNNFFPPAAYVLSFVVTQLPQSTIECILYSTCVYWVRVQPA